MQEGAFLLEELIPGDLIRPALQLGCQGHPFRGEVRQEDLIEFQPLDPVHRRQAQG
jgi:hypothetical protein